MSQNETVSWLVIYDIADKRRLARVFKALKKVGTPVQYSVFSVDASATGMAALVVQLAQLIHPKEDEVRAYRLPTKGWRATLGDAILPDGVWLVQTYPEINHHVFISLQQARQTRQTLRQVLVSTGFFGECGEYPSPEFKGINKPMKMPLFKQHNRSKWHKPISANRKVLHAQCTIGTTQILVTPPLRP